MNSLIVVLKVSIVLMVIALGWGFINPANHTPMIPEASLYTTPGGVTHAYGGIMGILGAAGVVFFAYIGFDAVSTAAQEAKNPSRDMPIGILGSLVICTVLYILFAYVLSGLAPVADFRNRRSAAKPPSRMRSRPTCRGTPGCRTSVTVAILAGFSSVILVMLLGQSRVFYSMSRDGLVPKVFSDIHPKYRTPHKSNMLFFVFTALFAAFVPGDIVGEMTSIGTLFAFILVCVGVWIMRDRRPDIPRGFTVPALPVVAMLGIIICGAMIYGLGWTNWLRLAGWLAVGMVIYFGYSKSSTASSTPSASSKGRVAIAARPLFSCSPCRHDDSMARRWPPPSGRNWSRASTAFQVRAGRPPALDIVLVGDDPASQVYVRNKERAGAEAGLRVTVHRLPATTSRDELLRLVEALNASPVCDGILVQSPLPAAMGKAAAQVVFDAIDPRRTWTGFIRTTSACSPRDGRRSRPARRPASSSCSIARDWPLPAGTPS